MARIRRTFLRDWQVWYFQLIKISIIKAVKCIYQKWMFSSSWYHKITSPEEWCWSCSVWQSRSHGRQASTWFWKFDFLFVEWHGGFFQWHGGEWHDYERDDQWLEMMMVMMIMTLMTILTPYWDVERRGRSEQTPPPPGRPRALFWTWWTKMIINSSDYDMYNV